MRGWSGMRVVRGRPHPSLVACGVVAVLLFLVYQGAGLVAKYGSLFYIETFLPSPPLPHQRRVSDTLNPPGQGAGGAEGAGRPLSAGGGPRLLCLVVTAPQFHQSRARHVKETWTRHCDRAVFLSSEADSALGEVVVVPQAPDYHQLWDKVIAGFEWSVEHLDQFEWLVKADDDTFLLVENLKNLLQDHNPDQLLATGLFLKDWTSGDTYLNGGAGYAVSRRVVRDVTQGVQPGGRCTQEGGMKMSPAEDLNMAECFRALGVTLIDSRDSYGRQRFHVYPPNNVLDPRKATDWGHLWLKKIPVYPYKFGYGEMSSEVISFHYVNAESMYLLYYLIYIVNPVRKTEPTEVLKQKPAVSAPSQRHLAPRSLSAESAPVADGHAAGNAVAFRSRRKVSGLQPSSFVTGDNLTTSDVRKSGLPRRNTKAVFGITRNKKYNYFYKSGDEGEDKDMFRSVDFKKPTIEKIGVAENAKRKWKINNRDSGSVDHSVL